MEQLREIGEVLGSIRALMVFKDNIHINQRQCTLLLDLFTATYDSVSESMRLNLRFGEKNTSKWKILEQPLRELLCVVREGEAYVRFSLEPKLGFWAKAVFLQHNKDCTELHVHNLLSCVPIIIEAIEMASEVSGWDEQEMNKKRLVHSNKYMKQWKDSQMFAWKFGREYLVTEDLCSRYESAWREDMWILTQELQEKRRPGSSKQDRKMAEFLLKNLGDGNELFPSSILVSSKDYQVRKRLGNGSQYKEITWLGESFALRHFFGDIDALLPQVTSLLSLSHPNIVYYLCGFADEEKKECFLVMELMSKSLGTHVKEVCGPRRKNTLSLPVAVDLMLQISRGMEYLHSKRVYHGELNPSNILVKPRRSNQTGDGYYLHGKICGFGLSSVKGFSFKSASSNESFPFIWYSPEVLEEQEQGGSSLKLVEQAKTCKKNNLRETSESGSEWASCSEDEGGGGSDEQVSSEKERRLSCSNEVGMRKKKPVSKRASGLKPIQKPGTPRVRSRHPPLSPCGQSMRTHSESQLIVLSPKIRRSSSGHVSDSELS
ncbi:hypothetical protein F2Q70_00042220 [Brassica cretica]|uniref:Protein kinase domain-containing protein n=2 Tax=Brassica cretica TaxID=69181 RepID=A0A8S9MDN7_BRACR|nr:hypothetical protein F2Q70_00042220 [Brassica cretica]KAF2617072.1 hypothetical protein F2Q68_00042888 [Brassica cretica]KAF3497413.1 hypothetical protein DY000_02058396 [Brassica cretica]